MTLDAEPVGPGLFSPQTKHIDAGLRMNVLAWPASSESNPYPQLLYSCVRSGVHVENYSARKLLGRFAVWHVHWPDAELNYRSVSRATSKVLKLIAALDWARRRGTKIVWTVHNCHSHENFHPKLEAWFWSQFIPRVDGVINLSRAAHLSAINQFPSLADVPNVVIPHGHYRSEYVAAHVNARQVLGIPANAQILLFSGLLRPYKNVDLLVRAFRQVTNRDALLYVLGQPSSRELEQKIRAEAGNDARIRFIFNFLQPGELAVYTRASDAVVLPYRDILNSGSALLSLSLNRPVVVPDLGSMGELKADVGDNWVKTFHGVVNSAILQDALKWARQPRPATCPIPDTYNWDNIGHATTRFYESVVAIPG